MAEIIIILKLDIDIDRISERTRKTSENVTAKVRAYAALTMAQELSQWGDGRLVSSAMAEEMDIVDTTTGQNLLRIVETNKVLDKKTGELL